MSTRTERRLRRGPAALLPALLLIGLLSGCSDDVAEPDAEAPSTRQKDSAGPRRPKPPKLPEVAEVAPALTRTLDRRADAVLRGDREAFLAGLDQRQAGFVTEQTVYADNLAQLPLATFAYDLEPASLVREDDSYWGEVDLTVRLDPYDDAPTVTRDRFLFTRGPGGRFVLASVTDPVWEEKQDLHPQPWETGPITVREGTGVLGIFDPGSASRAAALVGELERAADAVSAEVPYDWDRNVVVYALSSPTFLAGLDDVPGDDPLALDAVTFQVPVGPPDEGIADTRVVLNPHALDKPGAARSRLVRHELTHVAVGDRADDVPVWLSEGLAEYVSVRALSPRDRAISGAALAAAEKGIEEMPGEDAFAGSTAAASYGIAWWACEYVARGSDPSVLWLLLDAIADREAGEDPDEVLEDTLRLDADRLARKAGELLLDTYRPEPKQDPKEPEESEEPEESGSP